MRLNPHEVRLNIEMNIPAGREHGPDGGLRSGGGQSGGRRSEGIKINIPAGREHGPDGGQGSGSERGGLSGIPSPLVSHLPSGIPSPYLVSHPPIWYPIPLTGHQSGILHSLIFIIVDRYKLNSIF